MPEENSNSYIVDASFILTFLLPDENSEMVNYIFEEYSQGKNRFISSPLLPFEIINSLREASRKRVKEDRALALANEFLKINIDYQLIDFEKLLKFSIKNAISVYDASYLWLAQINKLPLLTLDKRLLKLAKN